MHQWKIANIARIETKKLDKIFMLIWALKIFT